MKVTITGAGYVGLTTACVLADQGHEVVCLDVDAGKLNRLMNGEVPFYEPGLDDVLARVLKSGMLKFTGEKKEAYSHGDVIMIAVGTPPEEDGSPNLTFLKEAVSDIAENLTVRKTIVTKSTVPPGTNEWIDAELAEKKDRSLFTVVSNPEFLKEGTALADTLNPDRMVAGSRSAEGVETVRKLFSFIDAPWHITSLTGAEMIKYASNVFLAAKISFINEMAAICHAYGVNVEEVARGIGADPRIGPAFLRPGLGYGGSCLPKDLSALIYAAEKKGLKPVLLPAAAEVNTRTAGDYIRLLEGELGTLRQKRIAVWGLSFKPDTDDTRHSPAAALIHALQAKGAEVLAYDPVVKEAPGGIVSHPDMYSAVTDADALALATEWDVFREADWLTVSMMMKGSTVMDCRNVLSPEKIKAAGLCYKAVARFSDGNDGE
ncbi:UDP-glucose dehydrogenase family protein [Alteribacter natronophilus]|uniref:UDP-glucose dehydrogenase family protein n=1 Tax=Alteribacter natronophilus TaxID=2583810 RepID=UPI0014874F29|nr:UDP-glucose/GDP-mannose dehydrogenase family protein [Alteribacter natronophilus]